MKNMMAGIVLCAVALAASVVYGGEEPGGVAAVNVVVKEKPDKRAVTDAHGNFALEALPAGSYTLSFRARSAKDLQHFTRSVVIVATSYSIKIEGTKRAANQSHLTSDKLIAGVDVMTDVGSGGSIRGRVLENGVKRMVWVPKTPDSSLPGHWAEEGTNDAVPSHNVSEIRRQDLLTPNR
jgi:hypothetical protein